MSAHIVDAVNGIITVEITGQISPAELAGLQAGILYHLLVWGGGSVLCTCVNFEGWTTGEWSDHSFQPQADSLIHKLAVFGESKWDTLAPNFTGKGVRPFPIACFGPGRQAEARAWLRA